MTINRQSVARMRSGRVLGGILARRYIRIPLQIFIPNLKRGAPIDSQVGCLWGSSGSELIGALSGSPSVFLGRHQVNPSV